MQMESWRERGGPESVLPCYFPGRVPLPVVPLLPSIHLGTLPSPDLYLELRFYFSSGPSSTIYHIRSRSHDSPLDQPVPVPDLQVIVRPATAGSPGSDLLVHPRPASRSAPDLLAHRARPACTSTLGSKSPLDQRIHPLQACKSLLDQRVLPL